MKLSFSLVPDTNNIADYLETIRMAEAAGIDRVWTPDQGFMSDPFIPIGLAGAATTKIDLGLGITSVFMRHPMQIARAAGTLSNLTNGRFTLGLGAGEKVRIRDAVGAPGGGFVPMTRTAIDVMRRLMAGEKVSVETEAFSLHNTELEFKVSHRVPIHVATTAPAAFRMAGECADGVIIGDVSDPGIIRQIIGWVKEGAAEAGRDLDDFEFIAWTSTILTDDAATTREQLRRPVAGTALVGMNKDTRALFGVNPEHVPLIKDARRNPDAPLPEDAITDEMIDALALVGTPQQVADRIAALGEAGITMLGFRMPVAMARHVDLPENVRRIAREVVPLVRKEG